MKNTWLISFTKLRFHPLFEAAVVCVIVVSALIAGVKTFPGTAQYQDAFNVLDYVISGILYIIYISLYIHIYIIQYRTYCI